jgi:hypothetical protein
LRDWIVEHDLTKLPFRQSQAQFPFAAERCIQEVENTPDVKEYGGKCVISVVHLDCS